MAWAIYRATSINNLLTKACLLHTQVQGAFGMSMHIFYASCPFMLEDLSSSVSHLRDLGKVQDHGSGTLWYFRIRRTIQLTLYGTLFRLRSLPAPKMSERFLEICMSRDQSSFVKLCYILDGYVHAIHTTCSTVLT